MPLRSYYEFDVWQTRYMVHYYRHIAHESVFVHYSDADKILLDVRPGIRAYTCNQTTDLHRILYHTSVLSQVDNETTAKVRERYIHC